MVIGMEKKMMIENRVREIRTRLEMRQSDLAAEVGVTRQSIIAIEKGRICPSILLALKIARILREPVDYVFYLSTRQGERDPESVESATQSDGPSAIWDFK